MKRRLDWTSNSLMMVNMSVFSPLAFVPVVMFIKMAIPFGVEIFKKRCAQCWWGNEVKTVAFVIVVCCGSGVCNYNMEPFLNIYDRIRRLRLAPTLQPWNKPCTPPPWNGPAVAWTQPWRRWWTCHQPFVGVCTSHCPSRCYIQFQILLQVNLDDWEIWSFGSFENWNTLVTWSHFSYVSIMCPNVRICA